MVLLQHRALMEELNRNKKDFEEIIRAKNKELEETKVRNKCILSCVHKMICCSKGNSLFNICLGCAWPPVVQNFCVLRWQLTLVSSTGGGGTLPFS